jgi:hypothetical protein
MVAQGFGIGHPIAGEHKQPAANSARRVLIEFTRTFEDSANIIKNSIKLDEIGFRKGGFWKVATHGCTPRF